MSKDVLNKKEKDEIKGDVKNALNMAKMRTMSEEEIKKQKKLHTQTSRASMISAILVIITIVFVGVYYYFSNNPKTIFMKALDDFSNSISSSFDEDVLEGIITINNTKINYSSDGSGTLYRIGDFTIYNENNVSYLYSKDISDKYIILDNSLLNYSASDISYIINTLNENFKNSVRNQKFKSSKDSIKVNGANIDVIVSTISLYSDEASAIASNISKKLNSNKDFLNACSKIGLSQSDITRLLGEFTDKFSRANVKNIEPRYIRVYSENFNHNFVKMEITSDVSNVITITKLSDNKYDFAYNDNKLTLSISKGNSFVKPTLDEAVSVSDFSLEDRKKIDNLVKVVNSK